MTKLIKTSTEIEGIAKSGHCLAKIMRILARQVKPGISTAQLEQSAKDLTAKAGGRPSFLGYVAGKNQPPFPSALCASINNEIVHGPALPGRILQNGDIVGLDLGLELNGYYSDMAITAPVGKISQAAKKLLRVTQAALRAGIKQIKPGRTLDDLGKAIQALVEKNQLSVVRDLVGHGVGSAVHEDPQIPHYAIASSGLPNLTFAPGMVLAIEPMVNAGSYKIKSSSDGFTWQTADNSLSAHFEHTVLVTDKGHKILTK